MVNKVRSFIGRNKNNISGWRTPEKIVVFESDDWGSIRIPSRKVYEELVGLGYPLHLRPFERFDRLECEDDFSSLFEVLSGISDSQGNHPVFTLNTILTNPDFEAMNRDRLELYSFELFTETYKRYFPAGNPFNAFKQGIDSKLVRPQLHGREHFNVERWMHRLRHADSDERLVFGNGMVGVPPRSNPEMGNQLMIAFDYDDEQQRVAQIQRVAEGARLFKSVFGFYSSSFIAPVYTWHSGIEETLSDSGVKYIQGGICQKEVFAPNKVRSRKHYLGERNFDGQIYLTRNVFFEPAVSSAKNIVADTIKYIEAAFFWKKPAVISSHRLNYMGGIDEANRKMNLALLRTLIHKILKKWPEVTFLTSEQLGDKIQKSQE